MPAQLGHNSLVKCRTCGAEIAEKAIVCYRCGTPTADLPPVIVTTPPRRSNVTTVVVMVLASAAVVWLWAARGQSVLVAQDTAPPKKTQQTLPFGAESETDTGTTPLALQLSRLLNATIALPVATALGVALALRPRRRGTPKRSAPIVQTQVILAVIGALVMLVVGSSLARAFGVVGAAGLVRYRAKVQDPKDAGVMLSTLAVGLAAGVGLYVLAAFAAVFIMWIELVPTSMAAIRMRYSTFTSIAVKFWFMLPRPCEPI